MLGRIWNLTPVPGPRVYFLWPGVSYLPRLVLAKETDLCPRATALGKQGPWVSVWGGREVLLGRVEGNP